MFRLLVSTACFSCEFLRGYVGGILADINRKLEAIVVAAPSKLVIFMKRPITRLCYLAHDGIMKMGLGNRFYVADGCQRV